MRNLALTALAAALITSPAHADSPVGGGDLDDSTLRTLVNSGKVSASADYSYTFDSDFKDDALGSLSVSRVNATLRVPVSLSENVRLQTGVSYRRLDFDSDSALIPDQMQGIAALIGLEYLIKGYPAIGIRSAPGFYFIDEIDSESFDAPTIFYAAWRFSPSLIGIAGASYSGLRTENSVVPLAGFIWNISEKVKFNAILPVASLDFQVSDSTRLSLIGEYVGQSVHTGEDLEDSTYDDTSLRYTEMRAGVQVAVELTDSTSLRFSGGWSFRQEFEFDQPDEDHRTDGAPFVGVSLRKAF